MDKAKSLVVTGASSGLGKHIAAAALGEGWRVVGVSRTPPADDPGFDFVALDVADAPAVSSFFRTLRQRDVWGLVNAAGIASMNLAVTTPWETMARIVAVNLLGTMHCCVEAAKLFARRKEGRIVNFSTIAVPLALAGESVYAASKAGVETFSRCFAREVSALGVTVNVVAPGPVPTPLLAGVGQEKIREIVRRQIRPRQATPDDIWRLVGFILSDDSAMLTGEVFHVGGV
jgi:3-oxoacyl-[acyl-carrier protein] reductase